MLEKRSIKYLLMIDTDYIFLQNIEKFMIKYNYQVSLANNSDSIPSILKKNRFDLILLEHDLPNNKGLYWLKWINNEYPTLPVMMTSNRLNEHERLEGLENGARDYLTKPFHEKELLIRTNNILRKEENIKSKTLEIKIGNVLFNTATNSSVHDKTTNLLI
ncbi:MAG: response regulator [Thiofilum sp.]|uniref:response regulator transcription factor n=1 Tax=Thiofilum sp. TaxID=2212733 RepID=UPI0025E325C0|nr:response regulator [Thiofilum sp.]MBK8452757.1 response regulator transcription factor [Thiofilum sp.]